MAVRTGINVADQNPFVKCPACEGTGATIPLYQPPLKVWIVCVWCNGSGAVTPNLAEQYTYYKHGGFIPPAKNVRYN